MKQDRIFSAAPWPTALRWSSGLGSILIVVLSVAAYQAIPVPTGFTHYFGLGVALIPGALLVWGFCTMILGYEVSTSYLIIRQALGSVRIPLASVTHAYADPAVCKGAVRVIGNGGLFGFTGLYQNPRLGRFRLYATDLRCAVVLVSPALTVVITPEAEQAFVAHIMRAHPHILGSESNAVA